ncbi:hypothetical protein FTO70_03310 [Methanosarcina sp. KYL-1]|uniref:hypothetical protein n=1 Tax=Methanosarcina sp. KYL-1 TaxID=2602068 RepID=UPI002100816E|nr:hypothetical protein [Methanosarcina sp. KYL-1]MCQ1534734.1 hypothetical protein [Methanosarcina sp. KYL-1]
MISVIETLQALDINYEALTDLVELITSILTLLIAFVLGRQAFVRWRKDLSTCLIFLWFSSILIHLKLILNLDVAAIFFIIGLITWVIVFFVVVRIFYNVLNLELIQFSKRDGLEFHDFIKDSFGSDCIDAAINEANDESEKGWPGATHNKQPGKKKGLYPLILAADECWRPWSIAQKFVANAILNNGRTGVIYFTFTRPHEHISDQIINKIKQKNPNFVASSLPLNNVVIIDCFTPLSLKSSENPGSLKSFINSIFSTNRLRGGTIDKGYLVADPRNPHLLNEFYEKSLLFLKNKRCESICVVYDALSDFLCFTDEKIAIQYLRHNMFWEEKNKVSSLYILRLNTLQNKFFEEYLLWFANTVFYLEVKDGKPILKTRGLFSEPKCYDIDYNLCRKYKCLDFYG